MPISRYSNHATAVKSSNDAAGLMLTMERPARLTDGGLQEFILAGPVPPYVDEALTQLILKHGCGVRLDRAGSIVSIIGRPEQLARLRADAADGDVA